MNPVKFWKITAEAAGNRLDVVIAGELEEYSRSLIRRLIESGDVLLNGRPGRPGQRVKPNDAVEIRLRIPPSLVTAPEDIPLRVVYQDSDLAIIDKPAGMVVHPSGGHRSGTLANALIALFPSVSSVGSASRPGIVHRLDKDTSGLLVVALNPRAQARLQAQIADHSARRRYLALVPGCLEPSDGTIDAPVGRDLKDRRRMAVHGVKARAARTSYRTMETFLTFSLLEAKLHTGRTHQIRVHLSALEHPIVGDALYGGPKLPGLTRQFLHAYRLRLRLPTSGEELEFESRLPDELSRVLAALRTEKTD